MMDIHAMPKVELHCHLDGSFRPETLFDVAHKDFITLSGDDVATYRALIHMRANARSVNEYLKMFADPLQCMQTRENLIRFTAELVEDLESQGVVYAEIRFAPQKHTDKGLSQAEAIEAVLEGRRQALAKCPHIRIGIIACMMSFGDEKLNWDANMETVHAASRYLGKGLVAIDLAGAEGIVPLRNFAPLFAEASRLHVPLTCHAGDSQGADTVLDAMNFGARRIGHGHHVYFDPAVCRQAIHNGVTLEICPTSNIQCMTEPSYEEHPAKNLLDMGMHVTINTDNMFLAGVTLDTEYDHCLNQMGFTPEDLVRMNRYAIQAAFCPQDVRDSVLHELDRFEAQP